MLHLNRLVLNHFMCVTHADLDFSKDKVIVLNGPNGHGKSTIQSAVALCLIEEKRGSSYTEYVQSGFKDCSVHLEAEIKNEPIIFDIALDTKFSGFTRKVLYNGKEYINSEVSDLLKSFEIDYFADIVMSTQGNTDDIIKVSPKERQRYLQKLLNFDFDSALESCREIVNEFETKIKENKVIIKVSNDSYSNKQHEIKDVAQLSFNETDISNLQTEVEKLSDSLKESYSINNEKNKFNQIKLKNKEELFKLKSKLSNYNSEIQRINQNVQKKVQLESEIKALSTEQDTLREQLSNLSASPEVDLSLLKSEQDLLNKNFFELSAEQKEAKVKLDLASQGKCPTCGNEFDSSDVSKYSSLVAELESKKTEVENKLNEVKKTIVEEESKINKIATEKRKIEAEIYIKERSKISKQHDAENLDINNSAEILSAMAETQARIENFEKEIIENDTKLSELESKSQAYIEINKEYIEKSNKLNEMSKTLFQNNIILENNAKARQSMIELKDRISESEKLIENYMKQQRTYDEVDTMFRKTFPNYLIVKTCTKLEQEMNDFIQIIFPLMAVRLFQNKSGVEFYYTTNLSKIKKWEKGEMLNVKMASGFEKSVLSIAFKVALCKAYNLPFAFLDEIDCFGDDTNSERLFESLIGSGLFEQLFIVSHKENVKSMIENRAKSFKMYYVKNGNFTLDEV